PIVLARILCPSEYIGNVQKLCHERRGTFKGMNYLDPQRVELDFELPLSEIVLDFYDRLKSGTRGYAGLDYEFIEMRPDQLVRLDILVNGDPVDAFSVIIHEDKAFLHGRDLVRKLKELIDGGLTPREAGRKLAEDEYYHLLIIRWYNFTTLHSRQVCT
ncbi:MAG: hypothetical protein DSY58_03735, partial [Desulfobulbus sp.]